MASGDVMRSASVKKNLGRGFAAVVVAAGLCLPAGTALAAEDDWEDMPSAVDDGSYPGAEQIFAEHGIRLLTGDGGIVFTGVKNRGEGQCATGEIQVEQVVENSAMRYVCFRSVGVPGFVTMELPRVFAVVSGEAPLRATVTAPGAARKVFDIEAKFSMYVAFEGADETPRTSLLELRLQSAG